MSDSERLSDRVEAALADEAVWADPPSEVESMLLASIVTDGTRTDERLSKALWRWRLATGIAALLAVVVGIVYTVGLVDEPAEGMLFPINGVEAGSEISGTATVGPAEAGWWIRLNVTGLPPAPGGSYYQGWVSDGEHIVSIGTFHMRDGDSVVLWSGVAISDYKDLSVTLQSVEGGADPSSSVVVEGRLESG
jgi:anti-sigma-K factor RskA